MSAVSPWLGAQKCCWKKIKFTLTLLHYWATRTSAKISLRPCLNQGSALRPYSSEGRRHPHGRAHYQRQESTISPSYNYYPWRDRYFQYLDLQHLARHVDRQDTQNQLAIWFACLAGSVLFFWCTSGYALSLTRIRPEASEDGDPSGLYATAEFWTPIPIARNDDVAWKDCVIVGYHDFSTYAALHFTMIYNGKLHLDLSPFDDSRTSGRRWACVTKALSIFLSRSLACWRLSA